MYQVGSLMSLSLDDPQFEDYREAIKRAEELSIDDSVYGVWTGQDEGGELLAIVYGGEVFIK